MTASPSPSARFRLRTFGTLTLTGSDDVTVLGQHGHHRRRLALLSMLAAAGDRGWSRDQLLVFFWPEATQERARHSLDQLLYALRGSISEDLFAASNPVSLNTQLVSSDVADFNGALEKGDLEGAVQLYRGPFLDGFYVDDAPEFEQWVEEERARLKSRYVSALERLAETADNAGERDSAVRWWRSLVDADPVSTRSALGLMRALLNAGDHAAALHFAEQYEGTVARELGTSVGPAVANLVAEVRAAASTHRVVPSRIPVESVVTAAGAIGVATTVAPRTSRRYRIGSTLLFAGPAFVIAASLFATRIGRTPDTDTRSIAVLPFRNVTRNAADAVLVDVLSEELITALSKVEGLRVISRQSSFQLRDSALSSRQIGDSLRVANLLEGSILRDGEKLRVQVRLVNAPNGVTRWSAAYDPLLRDFSSIQADIAGAVAKELGLVLKTDAANRLRRGVTQNIAAWDLYARARNPMYMRSDSGVSEALRQLEQAVGLDSTFAAAYATMPYMYFVMSRLARDSADAQALQLRAEAAARKALALDPDLPEAHVALAVALTPRYTDVSAIEAMLRRAIALGGTPRVREHLGRVLMWSGRYREALDESIRAASDDPLSATAEADVAEALCVNGRPDEGLARLAPLRDVRPPLPRVPGYRGICNAMKEQWREAIADIDASGGGYTPWSVMRDYFLARSGDSTEARRLEVETTAEWRATGRGAIKLALMAMANGDKDKAFLWLDRSGPDGLSAAAVFYPFFSELRSDPRFAAFRQRIGLK